MAINNSARKHPGIPPQINTLHIAQLRMVSTDQYIVTFVLNNGSLISYQHEKLVVKEILKVRK